MRTIWRAQPKARLCGSFPRRTKRRRERKSAHLAPLEWWISNLLQLKLGEPYLPSRVLYCLVSGHHWFYYLVEHQFSFSCLVSRPFTWIHYKVRCEFHCALDVVTPQVDLFFVRRGNRYQVEELRLSWWEEPLGFPFFVLFGWPKHLLSTWCLYIMRATTWKSIGNLTGQTLSDRQRKTRASLLLLHSFLPLHFALITFVMNRRTGRERGLPLLK